MSYLYPLDPEITGFGRHLDFSNPSEDSPSGEKSTLHGLLTILQRNPSSEDDIAALQSRVSVFTSSDCSPKAKEIGDQIKSITTLISFNREHLINQINIALVEPSPSRKRASTQMSSPPQSPPHSPLQDQSNVQFPNSSYFTPERANNSEAVALNYTMPTFKEKPVQFPAFTEHSSSSFSFNTSTKEDLH
jgi:hypothetical protein